MATSDEYYRLISQTIFGFPVNFELSGDLDGDDPECWKDSGSEVSPERRMDLTRDASEYVSRCKSLCGFPFSGVVCEGGPEGFGVMKGSNSVAYMEVSGQNGNAPFDIKGKLPIASGELDKIASDPTFTDFQFTPILSGREELPPLTVQDFLDRKDRIFGITWERRSVFIRAFITDDTVDFFGSPSRVRMQEMIDNDNIASVGVRGKLLRAAPYQVQTLGAGDVPATNCRWILAYVTNIDVPGLPTPPFYDSNPGETWRIQQRNFSGVWDGDPAFTRAQGAVAADGELTGVPLEWKLLGVTLPSESALAVYRIEITKNGQWPPTGGTQFGPDQQPIGCYPPE